MTGPARDSGRPWVRDPGRFVVVGGRGGTAAELADLEIAAAALRRASGLLLRARGELVRAVWAASGGTGATATGAWRSSAWPGTGVPDGADELVRFLHSPVAPAVVAERLDELARRLREAVATYEDADRAARDRASAVGEWLGERPVVGGALGLVVGVRVAALVGGWAPVLAGVALVPGGAEAFARSAGTAWRDVPGRAVADGHAATLLRTASAFLRALAPGDQAPSPDALGLVAAVGARLVHDDDARVVVHRGAIVGRTPVASASDALALVASGTPAHGAAPGTVTIQRIDRPDGGRSWVVAIAGTQSAGVGGPNPNDMQTNLELVGGVPDGVTAAVGRAMERAGIGADEPVLLAGHSQGGMAAAALAGSLAGRFDVRAVLTAGSPDVPPATPRHVQVLRLERSTDAVPTLDGASTPGDRPAVTTVVDRRPVGPLVRAHEVDGYVAMAQDVERAAAGDPSVRAWLRAADDVLAPPGSTAVTREYVLERVRPAASPGSAGTGRS